MATCCHNVRLKGDIKRAATELSVAWPREPDELTGMLTEGVGVLSAGVSADLTLTGVVQMAVQCAIFDGCQISGQMAVQPHVCTRDGCQMVVSLVARWLTV
jgi:hypothetical protein